MEKNRAFRFCIFGLYVCFAAVSLVRCDATKTPHRYDTKPTRKKPRFLEKLDFYASLDASNPSPYISPPFAMAPYDSLPPISFPEDTPPYCVYPPFTPQPPSTVPSPTGHLPTLPGPTPIPPPSSPNPSNYLPSPTQPVLSPPNYEPSPPTSQPGPPPSPRFLPPVVYPPPLGPPPPHRVPPVAMWCVAKAAVPEPIIQEAMNYACGSGADCDQIQPGGPCFEPNTVLAHASYAFNSYWQRTKVSGGTCDFGGTALLVTVDPSYDGCHFVYL